jgi:hypothetical protein
LWEAAAAAAAEEEEEEEEEEECKFCNHSLNRLAVAGEPDQYRWLWTTNL